MEMKYYVDTNVVLNYPEIFETVDCIFLSHVNRELEKHERSGNEQLKYQVRNAKRLIEANESRITYDTKDYKFTLNNKYDSDYPDNQILEACVKNGHGLITNDILLRSKAREFDVPLLKLETNNKGDYSGVLDVFIDLSTEEGQKDLAKFYQSFNDNVYDLERNQYIALWDKSSPTFNREGEQTGYEVIDSLKWDGDKLVKLKYKNLDTNKYIEKTKPINCKQEMLFDLMQNDNITVKACTGCFGAGKDFVMLSHAVSYLDTKFDKIIWARNNVPLEGIPEIGFLKGDKIDKLMGYAMPLADFLGGVDGLEMMIQKDKIEIQHLAEMRGRDIKNALIYVTECQNMTKEHITLLLGRVGTGSQIWFNGDLKQTDKDLFRKNSGLRALQDILRGNELFGMVTLDKTERSKTAELAQLFEDK